MREGRTSRLTVYEAPRLTPLLLSFITFIFLVAPATDARGDGPDDESVELEADVITASPDDGSFEARGSVRLELEDFSVRSDLATFSPSSGKVETGALVAVGPDDTRVTAAEGIFFPDGRLQLRQPTLTVHKQRLEISAAGESLICDRGSCLIDAPSVTACPHPSPGYRLEARSLLMHPSGDMDLSRPVLVLGDTPVLALPWIRVRPPGSAGFTAPVVGYSEPGGFILGPAGQFPVGDQVLLSGHVAVRTSQGFETSSLLSAPGTELRLDHLHDHGDNDLRVRAEARRSTKRASFALDTDLATNEAVILDLETDPTFRAAPHGRNRLLLSTRARNVVLEAGLRYHQLFDQAGERDTLSPGPSPFVSGMLILPLPIPGVLPRFLARLDRFDYTGSAPGFPTSLGTAPPHTTLNANPGLFVDQGLGPFGLEISAATVHRLWLLEDRDPFSRNSAHLGAALSLPLIGRLGSLRHLLVPFVEYTAIPWTEGENPSWGTSSLDLVTRRHGVEAGLKTELGDVAHPSLEVTVYQRLDLPGMGEEEGPAYLHLSFRSGPRWLRTRGAASFDERERMVSGAHLTLSTEDPRGTGFVLGATWYGRGRGAHTDRLDLDYPMSSLWTQMPDESLEINDQVNLRLTDRLTVLAGVRIGVHPEAALNALVYGLRFGSSCGCISIGLTASHRPDSPVPDVLASLNLLEL